MVGGSSVSTASRNRIIAIVAGAITVVAIVLAFASGYLAQQWQWLRPAGELLLLAQLVGLIVLERHQIFEPVHEKVGGIEERTGRIDIKVDAVLKHLSDSGRTTICISPPEILRMGTRILRDALMRDYDAPQILRAAALSGRGGLLGERWEMEKELTENREAYASYLLLPDSSADSRARHWSIRILGVFAELENFERWWDRGLAPALDLTPLNLEVKLTVRAPMQAQLSPMVITGTHVVLSMDNRTSASHWGLVLEGRQHAHLFAQWFDELWSDLPGAHLMYSRSGLDQEELDAFRRELVEAEAGVKNLTNFRKPGNRRDA